MWICSKFGFFSVVQKAPGEFHVRARCRQDLMNLKREARLRNLKVHRSEPADYRFRIIASRGQWEALSAALFASVDYSNFKGVIASTSEQRDKLPTYSAFHHDMERWQEEREPQPETAGRY